MLFENQTENKILSDFIADGFTYIPDFFTVEEVATISLNLDRVIEEVLPNIPESEVYYENEGDLSSLKQISSLNRHDHFFHNLLINPKLIQLSELLLNDPIIVKYLAYFNKPALIGKATPPHQDAYYFKISPPVALTIWVALESSDEENGNVKYIKGSHLNGLRPHDRSETFGFSQQILDFGTDEDLSNEVSIQVKAGDILIHHSLTIHRADMNFSKSRSRKGLGIVYYGESATEDQY